MADLLLIGIPAALALLFLLPALALLRLVRRHAGPGRTGATVCGVSCLLLTGFWVFVAGFHALTR